MPLVRVPPSLVLVVHGDTFHAGPAWKDANTAFRFFSDTIRYHVHFAKDGYSFSDGVQYLPDLKPRVSQPLSTSQDDLDPLLDAVCDESLVIEQASTDAFAATKRSDEPKLGNLAALTQQFGRVIHTRRAARSSREK